MSNKIDKYDWIVWGWENEEVINHASSNNLKEVFWVSLVIIIISITMMSFFLKKYMLDPLGAEPNDITVIASAIANRDLKITLPSGDVKGVYKATTEMVKSLKVMVSRVKGVSVDLGEASTNVGNAATRVNSSASLQMQNLEQTSTAMQQMSSTVDEVARNASNASAAANQSWENANNGVFVVKQVDKGLERLGVGISSAKEAIGKVEADANQVGTIVGVIEDIADQTSLLALNAAIEAARAGEQGKGFAVVAAEVRTLAERTQSSTSEIHELITSLQQGTERAVKAINSNEKDSNDISENSKQATHSLETILTSVTDIQDMNNQIATAAEEQTVVATQINTAIADIYDLAKKTHSGSESNKKLAST